MKIGFVGLGAMGLPIARRLAAHADIELALYDVSEARLALADAAGRRASSAADAARGADAVFSVLPADPHVEAVAAEVAGAAPPLFVDFSTIGPATIERVAASLARAGTTTVSVAITRGAVAAEAGTLALFVGGELPESLRPAFAAIATEVRHCGGIGAAKAVKIANNMILACSNVAVCEALVLGRKLGLAAQTVTTALETSAPGWALRNHIVAGVLAGDLGPGHFSTVNMLKDVRLFLELAAAQGLPSPLAGVAAACYRGTIASGFAEHHHPVVVRWLEAGAATDDVTSPPPAVGPSPDALDMLCRAVRAVYVLADLDALTVAARSGIAATEAAGHIASGSGANEALDEVAAAVDAGRTPPADGLLADLTALLALAGGAETPALIFEAARHAALALAR
jgi:3-hydroxyisobutyrate dehydrogenase-like beta-hydroxyacid dehydrogenase